MIREFLFEPYPLFQRKWHWIFLISLIITVFMLIFQPFGLSENRGIRLIMIIAGYGAISVFILMFNYLLVPNLLRNWFDEKSWNVLKQIAWHVWTIFTIGSGNCIYSSILVSSWSLHRFLVFQYYTLAVGVLPIIILTILNRNLMLSRNLESTREFNEQLSHKSNLSIQDRLICLSSENGKDKLEIGFSDLLYIESTGNYIKVVSFKENKLSKSLLRSTLKRAEMQIQDGTSLIKCHRAFLVNMNKIIHVRGNSQGLRLVLDHTETEIPVSRNYSKSLRKKLSR